MKTGYACSLDSQELSEQIKQLELYGCDKIVSDIAVSTFKERKNFKELMENIKPNSKLVFVKLKYLARNAKDLSIILQRLNEKNIIYKCLQDDAINIFLNSPQCLYLMKQFQNFNKDYDKDKSWTIRFLRDKGYSVAAIALKLNTTRTKVYNILKRY